MEQPSLAQLTAAAVSTVPHTEQPALHSALPLYRRQRAGTTQPLQQATEAEEETDGLMAG